MPLPEAKEAVRAASVGADPRVSFSTGLKVPARSLEASMRGSDDDGEKSPGYHDLQSLHGDTVRALLKRCHNRV